MERREEQCGGRKERYILNISRKNAKEKGCHSDEFQQGLLEGCQGGVESEKKSLKPLLLSAVYLGTLLRFHLFCRQDNG